MASSQTREHQPEDEEEEEQDQDQDQDHEYAQTPTTLQFKPIFDQRHYTRPGSSVAKVHETFKRAGIEIDEYSFDKTQQFDRSSNRIASIFRFMRLLSSSLTGQSVQKLFRLIRCSLRFKTTLMIANDDRDREALIADSNEDKLMIRCIEECSENLGYVTLRALAIVREFGSPEAQSLGLYAILNNNVTLQKFAKLVRLLYLDNTLYLQKKHSATTVLKQQMQEQNQILQYLQEFTLPRPSDLQPSDREPYHPHLAALDYQAEHAAESDLWQEISSEWPAIMGYIRLQEQSIQLRREEAAPVPVFRMNIGAKETDEEMKRKVEFARAEQSQTYIRRLLIQAKQPSKTLEGLMGVGSNLYVAIFNVLMQIGDALHLHQAMSVDEILELMIGCTLIRKMKFCEAVMLRFAFDHVTEKRSDARIAILRAMSQLLQSDYDFIVLSVHGHKLEQQASSHINSAAAAAPASHPSKRQRLV